MQSSATACPAVREIPGRSCAEKALAAALSSGRRSFWYLAVFQADHVAEILEQGQYDTADRALLSYCQDLVRVLPLPARVYRWSGTALIFLMERADDPLELRRSVERLPVTGTRCLIPLVLADGVDQLAREVDLFIASSL